MENNIFVKRRKSGQDNLDPIKAGLYSKIAIFQPILLKLFQIFTIALKTKWPCLLQAGLN